MGKLRTGGLITRPGVGLALGALYMAGGMARAATDHARAERVAQVAAGNFSESVLQREAADPAVTERTLLRLLLECLLDVREGLDDLVAIASEPEE